MFTLQKAPQQGFIERSRLTVFISEINTFLSGDFYKTPVKLHPLNLSFVSFSQDILNSKEMQTRLSHDLLLTLFSTKLILSAVIHF